MILLYLYDHQRIARPQLCTKCFLPTLEISQPGFHIVINLSCELKESSRVGEKCRNSVSNITAVIVSGCEGQIVCHLCWAAAGEGEDFQLKRYLERGTPRWNNQKKIVFLDSYFYRVSPSKCHFLLACHRD